MTQSDVTTPTESAKGVSNQDIMAVVVSYNGIATIQDTVRALVGQVGHVYVVDNGSSEETKNILTRLEKKKHISAIYLADNFGIGVALNIGIEAARERGYRWLLTMDQDSLADEHMVDAYCAAINQDPNVVCLSPTIVERRSSTTNEPVWRVTYAITSGNLVRTDVFGEIGGYDEGFFIDCIDFDFSLRLRRAGHNIFRVSDARMSHQLGLSSSVPRSIATVYSRHAPMRRYYMARNHLFLLERYLLSFPWFTAKLTLLQALSFVLVLVLENNRVANARYMICGMRDYLRRKKGAFAA